MDASRPGIAIVGAGLMGRWHAAAAQRAGARLLAVVDQDARIGARLAKRFGAPALADIERLFDLVPTPTVAHVCTPASGHVELARRLLERGLHVVCEKPLALDAEGVAQLYACARHAGSQLCPVHQFTAQRGFAQALACLPSLGTLCRVAFTFHSAGGNGSSVEARDALVAEILPHPLSLLAQLQPTLALADIAWAVQSPSPGEWLAIGSHGAATVSIAISLSARPTQAGAVIAGSKGTIALDFFHGFATLGRGVPSRADKMLRPFAASLAQFGAASGNAVQRALSRETAYPGLRALLERFYGSLARPGSAPFREAEVIDVYRARDQLAAATTRARRR